MKTDRPFTADFGLDLRRRLQLGAGQPQGHSRRAVERSTPTLMLLYSLVVLWFDWEGGRRWHAPRLPWYPGKRHPSFADMLAALRQHTLEHSLRGFFEDPAATSGYQNSRRHPPGIRPTGRMRRRKR